MKKFALVGLVFVFGWLFLRMSPLTHTSADAGCSISYSTEPFNRAHFTISSPSEGWHTVNFGNGFSTDVEVAGGVGSTWTDYTTNSASYTVTVSGPTSCSVQVTILNPSDGGGGDGPSDTPASQPVAPYGSWQCNSNTVFVLEGGNHLLITGVWMGEGKPWITIDPGNGVSFDVQPTFEGTFGGHTFYEFTQPGTYQVRVFIKDSGASCGTFEVQIGDGTAGPVVAEATVQSEQPTEVVSGTTTTESGHGWTLEVQNGFYLLHHQWLGDNFRNSGVCERAVNVYISDDGNTLHYTLDGVEYTTTMYGKPPVPGC